MGAGTLLSLALYLWVLKSPWLMALALVCFAQVLVMCASLRLARNRKSQQAVTLMCLGNWVSALLITFVAPMLLAVVALAALLPVIFAERYVRGKRLLAFTATTASCLLVLGALAGLRDTSGLSDKLPKSVANGVVIAGLPAMAILICWSRGITLRHCAIPLGSSRPRAPVSSPQPTMSAGASNAICTTEHSNTSSRWPYCCSSPVRLTNSAPKSYSPKPLN